MNQFTIPTYTVTVIEGKDSGVYKGQLILLTQEQWDEYVESSKETHRKVFIGTTTYNGERITVYSEL